MQLEQEKQKVEVEKQKADREAEERRAQLAWEKERWEREEGHRRDTRQTEQQKQRSIMNRLKIAADSLKHVLPNQPPDAAELPLFFKTVEGFFQGCSLGLERLGLVLVSRQERLGLVSVSSWS